MNYKNRTTKQTAARSYAMFVSCRYCTLPPRPTVGGGRGVERGLLCVVSVCVGVPDFALPCTHHHFALCAAVDETMVECRTARIAHLLAVVVTVVGVVDDSAAGFMLFLHA